MKIVGYCRVSTGNQKEEGTIEIQEQALREYALNNGLYVYKIFKDDGVSGGLEDRPGLAQLFNYLENPENKEVSGVLIYKLDRLARDLYIQEHLIKKLELLNKRLISVKERDLESDDPMRKAFRQFMGIVSELEKAFITMRLSAGRLSKARKGGFAGGCVALGYQTKDKELSVNLEQSGIITHIFMLKRVGNSYRDIARDLNKGKYPTSRGGKWHASTVRYIVNNPIYLGKLVYKSIMADRKDLNLILQ